MNSQREAADRQIAANVLSSQFKRKPFFLQTNRRFPCVHTKRQKQQNYKEK